jgi:hypothetical protein
LDRCDATVANLTHRQEIPAPIGEIEALFDCKLRAVMPTKLGTQEGGTPTSVGVGVGVINERLPAGSLFLRKQVHIPYKAIGSRNGTFAVS